MRLGAPPFPDLLLGLISLVAATAWGPTAWAGGLPEPVFEIDFARPNAADWRTFFDAEEGDGGPDLPGWGNHELQVYRVDPDNVAVVDGVLRIRARGSDPARLDGPGPTSARLVSRKGLLPRYGRFEIRARVPCERGYWPAIWMLGEGDVWPRRGEIDILEWSAFFLSQNEVQSALHAEAFHGAAARTDRRPLRKACGAFHTYKVLWLPDRVGFSADDAPLRPLYRKPKGAGLSQWPFDRDFRLILNVAVGGDLGGPAPSPDSAAELEVQWIRVYAPSSGIAVPAGGF